MQVGASGVGLAAIQIARHLFAAATYATASSDEKRSVCRQFGAVEAFDYRDEDWPEQVRAATGGEGVNLILDGQAGAYVQRELDLLRPDGRLVLIASHLGAVADVNVRDIVRRRLTLTGSTLRPRSAEFKGQIARALVEKVWPLLEDGTIKTRIHRVYRFQEIRAAHRLLDENRQIGKVVVTVD